MEDIGTRAVLHGCRVLGFHARYLAAAGLLLVVASARFTVTSPKTTSLPARSEVHRSCTFSEVSRKELYVDDKPVYVAADAIAVDGSDVLIAGHPSYVWSRSRDERRKRRYTQDSLIAAVVDGTGTVRAIPRPVARGARNPVVRPLAHDVWEVLFIELDDPPTSDERGSTLWYGTIENARWRSLERLPVPEGFTFNYRSQPVLVRDGAGAAAAVMVEHTDVLPRERILFLRQQNGEWSSEIVKARSGRRDPNQFTPTIIDFRRSRADELSLLTKTIDFDLPDDPVRYGSFFLYSPADGWEEHTFLPGLKWGSISQFDFQQLGGREILTWLADSDVVAYSRRTEDEPFRDFVIETSHIPSHRIQTRLVMLRDSTPLWVTQSWNPVQPSADNLAPLRFHIATGDTIVFADTMASPFMLFQAAAVLDDGDVLLAGARAHTEAADSFFTTMLLRVRPHCRGPR